MANDPFEYDVALSFAREDKTVAEEIANLLTERNFTVFYDEYSGDGTWVRDVVDHLVNVYARKARYCVIFISQYYPLLSWTVEDRESAQQRSLRDADEYILPVRLDDATVPGIAETPGYQDLRQSSMESIVDFLEQKLTETKSRPVPPPQSHDLRSGNVPSTHD